MIYIGDIYFRGTLKYLRHMINNNTLIFVGLGNELTIINNVSSGLKKVDN